MQALHICSPIKVFGCRKRRGLVGAKTAKALLIGFVANKGLKAKNVSTARVNCLLKLIWGILTRPWHMFELIKYIPLL